MRTCSLEAWTLKESTPKFSSPWPQRSFHSVESSAWRSVWFLAVDAMAGDPLDRYPRTPHNRPLSGEFSWSILSHLSVFFGEISNIYFGLCFCVESPSFKWALVRHRIGAAWTHNKLWRNSVAFSRHQVWNVKPSPKFLRLAFYFLYLLHIPLFVKQNSFRSTVSGFTKKQTKKVEIHRNLTALTFGSVKK